MKKDEGSTEHRVSEPLVLCAVARRYRYKKEERYGICRKGWNDCI